MNRPRVSEHFYLSELACRCGCGAMIVVPQFVAALEDLRKQLSCPISVSSWVRCAKHNALCGGAENSLHLVGKAADIFVAHLSPTELAEAAEKIPSFSSGGIGIYDSWVHVDIGPQRRWRK